jgi:secondary thiamine-phosphate synthase enzyme
MFRDEFSLRTEERVEIIDITSRIEEIVGKSGVEDGFALAYTEHVTACLTINENDRELLEDIKENLLRLVPIDPGVAGVRYRHNEKYSSMPREQNTHAHILATLMKPSIIVPIEEGRLRLGTWQSLFFFELDGPRSRNVQVQVWG